MIDRRNDRPWLRELKQATAPLNRRNRLQGSQTIEHPLLCWTFGVREIARLGQRLSSLPNEYFEQLILAAVKVLSAKHQAAGPKLDRGLSGRG